MVVLRHWLGLSVRETAQELRNRRGHGQEPQQPRARRARGGARAPALRPPSCCGHAPSPPGRHRVAALLAGLLSWTTATPAAADPHPGRRWWTVLRAVDRRARPGVVRRGAGRLRDRGTPRRWSPCRSSPATWPTGPAGSPASPSRRASRPSDGRSAPPCAAPGSRRSTWCGSCRRPTSRRPAPGGCAATWCSVTATHCCRCRRTRAASAPARGPRTCRAAWPVATRTSPSAPSRTPSAPPTRSGWAGGPTAPGARGSAWPPTAAATSSTRAPTAFAWPTRVGWKAGDRTLVCYTQTRG